MQKITPCLWFDNQAEEAVKLYTSVFKDSKTGKISYYDKEASVVSGQPEGSILTIEFTIFGQNFTAMNGGPAFKFSEAVSFQIYCEDQAEIDYLWEKLSADPSSEQCGWCKDKFGLSWQIVPKNIGELVSSPEGMSAMLNMKKLVIADLEKATE